MIVAINLRIIYFTPVELRFIIVNSKLQMGYS